MPLYRHTKLPPPPELGDKKLWDYLPRGSTRRVFFLLLALGGVVVLKHTSGWSFGGMLDAPRTPPAGSAADPGAPVYHIRVERPGETPPPKSGP